MKQPSILLDLAFLRLWTGATASGLATWALPFVLGLAVFDRALAATDLGLLLAARTAGSSPRSPWPECSRTGTRAGASSCGRAWPPVPRRR